MRVLKVAQEDVADKIDTAYILEQFRHLNKVVITFMCTRDEREIEDWTDEDGRYINIRLPYKEVKQLTDIRPLMLAKVRERLGAMA